MVAEGPERKPGVLRNIVVKTGRSVTPGSGGTDDSLSLLDRYLVDFAALSRRRDSRRIELMRSHGGWEVRGQDGDTVLLARVPSGGDHSISQGR
jgi:hypothetical protein